MVYIIWPPVLRVYYSILHFLHKCQRWITSMSSGVTGSAVVSNIKRMCPAFQHKWISAVIPNIYRHIFEDLVKKKISIFCSVCKHCITHYTDAFLIFRSRFLQSCFHIGLVVWWYKISDGVLCPLTQVGNSCRLFQSSGRLVWCLDCGGHTAYLPHRFISPLNLETIIRSNHSRRS